MSKLSLFRVYDGHPERRMRGDEKSKKAAGGVQAALGPAQQPELTDTPPVRRVRPKHAKEPAPAALPKTGELPRVRRVRRSRP